MMQHNAADALVHNSKALNSFFALISAVSVARVSASGPQKLKASASEHNNTHPLRTSMSAIHAKCANCGEVKLVFSYRQRRRPDGTVSLASTCNKCVAFKRRGCTLARYVHNLVADSDDEPLVPPKRARVEPVALLPGPPDMLLTESEAETESDAEPDQSADESDSSSSCTESEADEGDKELDHDGSTVADSDGEDHKHDDSTRRPARGLVQFARPKRIRLIGMLLSWSTAMVADAEGVGYAQVQAWRNEVDRLARVQNYHKDHVPAAHEIDIPLLADMLEKPCVDTWGHIGLERRNGYVR